MRQALHIFRKDMRRHWPIALIFWALTVTFAFQQPREWRSATFNNRFFDRAMEFVPFLLVLCWAILIIRIAHEENFVGDRQFWITRPYEWLKLLLAKLLGSLVLVHLPLFVMQLALLKIAHFPVISSIPGLLWIHLVLALLVDLPCLFVAAVTSGIGQAFLVVLAALSFIGGVLAALNYLTDMEFIMDRLSPALAVALLASMVLVILVQYIYRRSRIARLMAIGSFLFAAVVVLLAPYANLAPDPSFALASADHPSPAHFALDRTLAFLHGTGKETDFSYRESEVEVEFPLSISDLASQTVFQFEAANLDVTPTKGERWSSHWQHFSQGVSYGRSRSWVTINLKRRDFVRLAYSSVHARLAIALSVFKLGAGVRIPVSGPNLALPGGARCRYFPLAHSFKCFSALRSPSPLFIMTDLPNSSCSSTPSESSREPWASGPASYIALSTDTYPDPALSPIQDSIISLRRFRQSEDLDSDLPICRGTVLFVNQPQFLYATRLEIDLGELFLEDYHPTYPREIGPPPKHLTLDDPPDSESLRCPTNPTSPDSGHTPGASLSEEAR